MDRGDNPPQSDAEQEMTLSCLPYDVLAEIANKLSAEDVLFGLSETDSKIHGNLSCESFWRNRFKQRYPFLYETTHSFPFSTQSSFWKKRCYYREKILNSFDGKDLLKHSSSRMRLSTWATEAMDGFFDSDEEEDLAMMDFACLKFCNSGHTLVAVDCHQNAVHCWQLTDIEDHDPQLPAPTIIRDLHEDLETTGEVICSLSAWQNMVSTAASDGTIVLTDLQTESAFQTLRSKERILSHDWQPRTIVAGTFRGSVEIFDDRVSEPVFSRADILDDAQLFDGIQVALAGNSVIAFGWNGNRRHIKSLDIRTGDVLTDVEVPGIELPPPAGHWGNNANRNPACLQVCDTSVWIGGEKGKILEYDLNSLDLVRDYTEKLGHERHVAGLHHAYGFLASISHSGRTSNSLFYRTAVHDLGKPEPTLVWEYNLPSQAGGLSCMAFYPERCYLAVALTTEVKLWRPQQD